MERTKHKKQERTEKRIERKQIPGVISGILLFMLLLLGGCGTQNAETSPAEEVTGVSETQEMPGLQHSSDLSEVSDTADAEHLQEAAAIDGAPDAEAAEDGNTQTAEIPAADTEQPGEAENAESMALHVDGTQLKDAQGNAVQLRGLSTHGLSWYPQYVNEDAFRWFRDAWHANVIRLAMYTAESGGYCTDGDRDYLKKLIQDGVSYATALDLYVIIDWHILSDGNPNTYKEEARQFFAEMSAQYAEQDNVLYEICNEPNGGVSWADVKAYAEEVIPVIRENDSDAVILVGMPTWCQDVGSAAADPITGYENIMYTLHFYAASHTDDLRNQMKQAIAAGLPVFVSEYGICDASGNGAIDETQAQAWINLLNDCGVSYVAWNISNKEETSAIFSSSCTKSEDFTEEDLSASGRWLYEMLRR